MHLAPPQSSCALWQGMEMLSPCYGCMDSPNLWGKGFELLAQSGAGGSTHGARALPAPCSVAVWTIQGDSSLGNSMEPESLPSANRPCPAPPAKAWPPWSVGRAAPRAHQQLLCPADGGTPWSKQVPSTAPAAHTSQARLCHPLQLAALPTHASVREEHKQPAEENASEKDSDPSRSLSV